MKELPIQFVMWITGDSKEDVIKLYERWNNSYKCINCQVNIANKEGICFICENEVVKENE